MAGTYPDSQIPRARSARQQFWLDHLRAWQARGTSLRAYAAANGLSSSSLYRTVRARGTAYCHKVAAARSSEISLRHGY